jgi:hypothetical protein
MSKIKGNYQDGLIKTENSDCSGSNPEGFDMQDLIQNSELANKKCATNRRKYHVRSALTNRALLRDQLQLKDEQQPLEELIKSAIGPDCLSFTPEQAKILVKHGVGKIFINK